MSERYTFIPTDVVLAGLVHAGFVPVDHSDPHPAGPPDVGPACGPVYDAFRGRVDLRDAISGGGLSHIHTDTAYQIRFRALPCPAPWPHRVPEQFRPVCIAPRDIVEKSGPGPELSERF